MGLSTNGIETQTPLDWTSKTSAEATYVVCALALDEAAWYKGLPDKSSQRLPLIDFESPATSLDRTYRAVPREEQPNACRIVEDAFRWCAMNFPLGVPTETDRLRFLAPRYIDVRLTPSNIYLAASSADRLGHILLGAPWPVECTYRLASLIAHEAVHQGLFLREQHSSPVRPGSLGYSPWRCRTRPGRLVWHAFWTFACQFSLLVSAASGNEGAIQIDRDLVDFMATMPPRCESCLDSLIQFDIVKDSELIRCADALSYVALSADRLSRRSQFAVRLDAERAKTAADYRDWAESIMSSQESGSKSMRR
jgi:hypothetical protein